MIRSIRISKGFKVFEYWVSRGNDDSLHEFLYGGNPNNFRLKIVVRDVYASTKFSQNIKLKCLLPKK